MESLLGTSSAQQTRRLKCICAALSVICLLLTLALVTLVSLCFDNRGSTNDERVVVGEMSYWKGPFNRSSENLVTVSGLKYETKINLTRLLGKSRFIVRLNESVVDLDLITGEKNPLSNSTEALYTNKSCVAPSVMINETCTYVSEKAGSWWEAYARCDLLGLRISSANRR